MKLYTTGFSNYLSHNEAEVRFKQIKSPAVLELSKDGTAWIAWLSTNKSYHGIPYVGTQPQYNEAAKKLMEVA